MTPMPKGPPMDAREALKLYDLPLAELCARADRARREAGLCRVDLCTIVNAKSGLCGEDCRFCAQSARHATEVDEHALLDVEKLVEAARRAYEIGSARLGIVTSGNCLSEEELSRVAEAVRAIRREVGLDVCASLGALEADELAELREAGLSRYHHNLETSRDFFPQVATSHTFDDRVRTVASARDAGLSVCCGGIVGMGETREDRVSLALAVRDLGADSVPLNFLIPVPGTPMEDVEPMRPAEALRTIAVFRILMPGRTIRVTAGRETVLRDFQAAAFLAGANGMMIGGYLTQRGRAVEDDQRLVKEIEDAWTI